ncbi:tRNA-dependent cyclodipeptide synthase [Streptomyces platensis]|uniref:tRNA-dependent cyclodipeptide synthase n=1 Tax=Streptomyces platensis TaxID=58346 RepID=UPI002251E94C|nr:tRNA-dependent cyclodipeptide synthase [Streptomyces platensis]MCX4638462.1 tRNA-dependent cyclodipeptide synthase [Streptomyces platensis]
MLQCDLTAAFVACLPHELVGVMPSEAASPLAVPKQTSPPSGRGRYRTGISFVSPISRLHDFEAHSSCFLGISLENSSFRPAKVRSMAQWISRRFPRCTVLVGDSIHRITVESTRGLRPPEALAEALRLGREFIDDQAQIFHEFQERTDFTFINCSEVQTWDSYQSYHRMLRDYFGQDARFRTSLEAFGRGYHSKNSGGAPEAELERRIQRSLDYFLEEFAIFCCLKDRGLPVMLYPGSFGTLSEIAAGDHEGAPKPLRDLIVVSLQLRGR